MGDGAEMKLHYDFLGGLVDPAGGSVSLSWIHVGV